MKLSYKWLSQYVDLSGITPAELADRMTKAGLEVEGVEALASGTNLAIGEVIFCEDIPDTHLHNTITRVGEAEYRIVCGAPNCRKGLKVIVALPGAVLPLGVISAKPVHGYESNGMLCSLSELGVSKKVLSEKQLAGIEELDADAVSGERNVLEYLGLDDTVLDVSLTPNRSDCNAMWNMAKEVGAILKRKVSLPWQEGASNIGKKSDFVVKSETEKCTAFLGKVINHVKVGPSPKWLKQYLQAYGMNSINNVVDISNFVMLETGQPLHFYDLNKLKNKDITVVSGRQTEMKALDGVTFAIEPEDILITTGKEATGIAGIMGGEESMIDEKTTSIFIEAAHFSAVSVRKTSIRLNLLTEAAQRFTKGIDPLAMFKAMDRCVELLTKYANASDFEENVYFNTKPYEEKVITETLEHCNGLLGTSFTIEQLIDVCTRLDFQPEVKGNAITCHIPSYRTDMEGVADIDEEVIRLLGYDDLQSSLPMMEPTVGMLSYAQKARRLTREIFTGCGLHEMISYTLVSDAWNDEASQPVGQAISLSMPMSEARKYIRTSLLNSVLDVVKYNEAHGNNDSAYYEISKVYGEGVNDERVAIVLSGKIVDDALHKHEEKADFYTMKGILMLWLERFGFVSERVKLTPNTKDTKRFHPYRSCVLMIDDKEIGIFGDIHPKYAKKFDLQEVVYGEMSFDTLLSLTPGRLKFIPLDKYPSVVRDLALVVEKDVSAHKILHTVKTAGKKIVKDAEIFDIYEGEHVEKGKKSVALHIVYQVSDHTLREEEILPIHENILKTLKETLNAQLRA